MGSRSSLRQIAHAGAAVIVSGLVLAVPACSDSSGPDGGNLRQARAVVYGTVTGNGEAAAGVEVTVTPYTATCEQQLLGGAEPAVTTDSEGRYRVVVQREIVGSSVTACPEVEFQPSAGSGLAEETLTAQENSDKLFDLRDVNAGIGIDSVAVDADLTP